MVNSASRLLKTDRALTAILLLVTMITMVCFVGVISFLPQGAAAVNDSGSVDVKMAVPGVLVMSLDNCDTATDPDSSHLNIEIITDVSSDTYGANCQTVSVATNTPGYSLSIRANSDDGSNSLIYQNPTTITPIPKVPSIASTATPTVPAVLTANTWGFAVEDELGFDTSYSTNPANVPTNKFASLPTTDTAIVDTNELPGEIESYVFYYAARVDFTIPAGAYATTVTYTAVGKPIPDPLTYCGTYDFECIIFTINTADGNYSIPTSGAVTGTASTHAYNWLVYVDGQPITSCGGNNNCTGTSSTSSTPGANGIALAGLGSGAHQIKILPNGTPTPGWGNAFGHYITTTGANTTTNKYKFISIDAPLTTMAFAPKTTESTTNASYMFAYLFSGCTNLTAGAIIIDTYKLPGTTNDLSNFLRSIHQDNTSLAVPVNLAQLPDWFSPNTSIANLASFLGFAHYNNTSLVLSGQRIFPNWMKTMTQGSTSIWNAGTSFYQTFYVPSSKAGDTGEPRFMDGTVLSSIGQPSTNRQTYTNRSGITPVYTNWK